MLFAKGMYPTEPNEVQGYPGQFYEKNQDTPIIRLFSKLIERKAHATSGSSYLSFIRDQQ